MPSLLGSEKLMAFVATRDPARAQEFYGNTLGLTLVSSDQFALVFDANGTMLRVAIVQKFTPAPYTVLGWHVPDIRQTVRRLRDAGVQLERFKGLNDEDELGIWEAPDRAKVAWFKDPDGNLLSVAQL
jgi:catechol 2,3-dioxygenase-like lactoylglutathione lyase family enzyme